MTLLVPYSGFAAVRTHIDHVATTTTGAPAGWVERPPLDFARAGHDVTTASGQIFAIGGFRITPFAFIDSVEARRTKGNGTWRNATFLPTPRGNPAAAELGGAVFVAGGINIDDAVLDVVEMFDPRTGSWTTLPKLPFPRGAAGAAGLGGLLYVAGGFVGLDETTSSVVAYDPENRSWKSVAPMPTSRSRLRLVASGRHLYAIGGQSAQGDTLSAVERYDPKSNTWAKVASMNHDRGLPGVVAVSHGSEHLIAVVGGIQAVRNELTAVLRSTEVYDLDTGRWRLLQTQLPSARASLGAAAEPDGTVLAIGGAVTVNGVVTATPEVLALKLTTHDQGGGGP